MHAERKIDTAARICREAGDAALAFFRDRAKLTIDRKGHQDWVTAADRSVETLIRERLAAAFPGDTIVGEEHGEAPGQTDFTWVIDPIDGTANFVNGIPLWCIVLAGVFRGETQMAVIHDPNANETFIAEQGQGATLNGRQIQVAIDTPLDAGTISVGYSNRADPHRLLPVLGDLLDHGAMFHRNASGALTLAYVAAGRLLGFLEEHMNAWDCLAGQLLITEAGGRTEKHNADTVIAEGARVIAAAPQVFDTLVDICDSHWRREN